MCEPGVPSLSPPTLSPQHPPKQPVGQVSRAALAPWQSFLAAPAASWLDDFITWLSPDAPLCCRQHGGDLGGGILGLGPNPDPAYCPPPDQEPCASDPTACADCRPCLGPGELSDGRPTLAQFQARLPWFLAAKPSAACAKGGAGAYDAALRRSASDATAVAGLSRGRVDASAFRTSYVSLSRQADFIQALQVGGIGRRKMDRPEGGGITTFHTAQAGSSPPQF